jgi:succinoglycan biosynthesis transport protein ExoP
VSAEELPAPNRVGIDEREPGSDSSHPGTSVDLAGRGAREGRDRLIGAPFLPPQEVAATPVSGTASVVLDSRSQVSEYFRILATKVRMLVSPDRPACIGVVSAAAGEGKTTVSIGLAHALTRTVATRVALLDLDLRRPALAHSLGLGKAEGIGEWLDNRSEGIPLRRRSDVDFVVATAGELISGSYELLGGPPMLGALEAARQAFEFTLLDLPPLGPVADAVAIQDHIDGFLLVVRSRHCPAEAIQAAVSRLRVGMLLGIVFNDQRDIIPGYYNYASRRYGKD